LPTRAHPVVFRGPYPQSSTAGPILSFAVSPEIATLDGPHCLLHNNDGSTFRAVMPAPPLTVRVAESAFGAAGPNLRYASPEHSPKHWITVIELWAE